MVFCWASDNFYSVCQIEFSVTLCQCVVIMCLSVSLSVFQCVYLFMLKAKTRLKFTKRYQTHDKKITHSTK